MRWDISGLCFLDLLRDIPHHDLLHREPNHYLEITYPSSQQYPSQKRYATILKQPKFVHAVAKKPKFLCKKGGKENPITFDFSCFFIFLSK